MGDVIRVVIFALIVGLFGLVGLYLRKNIFKYLHALTARTAWRGDDIVIAALKAPFLLWCIIAGVYFGLLFVSLPQNLVTIINKVLLSLLIISITMVIAKICVGLSNTYARKLGSGIAVTGITRTLIYVLIFLVGVMILLNTLGISIAPLLTTLGIGGLAVALGLQDTLTNLFSGIYITASKQTRIGDYIKLSSGEEGYVVDINWRTTKIKPLRNNLILVPNSHLAQSIITNYYLPEKEMTVPIDMGVHYNSDLEKVEQVTLEEARKIMKEIKGGVPNFEPFVRYHTFGDFSINLTVYLRVTEFVDHYLICHEFIKNLHKRFAKENIVIPYPIRAINYEQEKAGK
ncbi:MAG: mechanosensitive ion channel family protein [Candidatus Omnitrophica bacterium]|nr:mechanosensitive ion channel family protein [Candidatus Omnitrophota bacterium]MBU1925147.1 mechanosensitive ion channel family protein [Candidatus Omnitrophota bacterium]